LRTFVRGVPVIEQSLRAILRQSDGRERKWEHAMPLRKPARARPRRFRPSRLWPSARTRQRAWLAFSRASLPMQLITAALLLGTLWLGINWVYQVVRKPSELFFPVSGTLKKTPAQTWQQYELIFRGNSTSVISADLLAAIAQVEASGNPLARTYWKWSWSLHPLQIYRPASSAVGMYQITDSTFAESKHYCIHNHVVVADGPWNDWHSCWFNSLYSRVIPAHAAELTSTYLDHSISAILERHRLTGVALQHKQELAAVIHLCGTGGGDEYARRGFRLFNDQHCGDQDVHAYVARIETMKAVFDHLAVLQNDQN
jgi:Transglycosylase SLT domain